MTTEFGKTIEALQKRHGMTLAQLGRKVGASRSYLSGWITGKLGAPRPRILKRVAKAFTEVRLEDLLELAWVSKAPLEIRPRLMARLAGQVTELNPLLDIEIRPATVSIPGANPKAKKAV